MIDEALHFAPDVMTGHFSPIISATGRSSKEGNQWEEGSWSEPVSSLYLTKSSCIGHPIISEINAEVEMDRSVCLMISRHPGHLIQQTIKCPLTSQSLPYCCPESLSFLILLTSYHQWHRKLHSSRKICHVRAFE